MPPAPTCSAQGCLLEGEQTTSGRRPEGWRGGGMNAEWRMELMHFWETLACGLKERHRQWLALMPEAHRIGAQGRAKWGSVVPGDPQHQPHGEPCGLTLSTRGAHAGWRFLSGKKGQASSDIFLQKSRLWVLLSFSSQVLDIPRTIKVYYWLNSILLKSICWSLNPPETQTVILVRERIFTEVPKLKWNNWRGGRLSYVNGVHIKREIGTHTCTGRMPREYDDGQLQANERELTRVLPSDPQKKPTLTTPGCQLPKLRGNTFLLFKWQFCGILFQ